MKKTIYQVEVGVLLKKDHPEYECYKTAFDRTYSYYNEGIWFCETLEEAKKSALDYVNAGVERTYAVISEINDFDDQEYEIINGTICYKVCYKNYEEECSEEFTDYSLEVVIYSACKLNNTTTVDFINKLTIE